MRPLLLIDFDDVICLNRPYGSFDVAQKNWPTDLSSKLWHRPALNVLEPLVEKFMPRIVVTSSWLRIMTLSSVEETFRRTGLPWFANVLHPHGEALQGSGMSRLDAVNAWLDAHHEGEEYVIVDDMLSGTGLVGSKHDRRGRVVMCQVDVGLTPAHAERIASALSTPAK
jgi:hypothetical protein